MRSALSRRDWFKTSLTIGAGLAFTSSLVEKLMAAPTSEAERLHSLNAIASQKLVRLGSNENP